MESFPQLHPLIRMELKNKLVYLAYKATDTRLLSRLHKIIDANTLAAKYSHASFNYRGKLYSKEHQQLRFNSQRLLPELKEYMDALLKDIDEIENTEKPFITGLFTTMLNVSGSVEDYLLILPECLAPAIKSEIVKAECVYPRQLTNEQLEAFKTKHMQWILMLKNRMVLELILT